MSHVGAVKLYDEYHEILLRNELVLAISKFSRGELKREDLEKLLHRFVKVVNANRGELEKMIIDGYLEGEVPNPQPGVSGKV